MLTVLTKQAVVNTRNALGESLLATLRERYMRLVGNEHESKEGTHTFTEFMTDLVHEVAYRYCNEKAGYGADGNWHEFASQWELTEGTYGAVLRAMLCVGYTSTLTKW